MYINVAVQYIRPKQSFYIQESLKRLILEVVEADDLDLEVDPSIVRLTNRHFVDSVSNVTSPRSTALGLRPKRCVLAFIDRTRIYLSTRH